MKYIKKPIIINAIKCSEAISLAKNNWKELPEWFKKSYEDGNVLICEGHISIGTLEGRMRADKEDMIICGIKGEMYPCKPDIFEAIYDLVE